MGLLGFVLLARADPGGAGRHDGSHGPWLLAVLAQSLACIGHALRGELPPLLVFSFVNALQILVGALLALGARRLLGPQVPGWFAALPSVLWLLACLVPGFMETQRARLGLYALLCLSLLGLALRDLLTFHARQGLRSALDLAVALGLWILAFFAIWGEALIAPRPLSGGWGVVGTAAGVAAATFAAALPFLMLAIRREMERAALEAARHAALAAGRAEVTRLHESLPTIIFLRTVQPDGTSRLTYRGGDVAAVTGWTEARFFGASGPLDIPGPDAITPRAHHQAQLQRTLREGMAKAEWPLRQPDDSHRHIRMETRLLGPAPGGGSEVVGYMRDTTQERLVEARAMASSRLASLGEMGIGLAHEVKQPLQALSLAAEIALTSLPDDAPPRVRRKLDLILQEAERAAGIVEHLRRFARGAPEHAAAETFALASPVEDALRLVQGTLSEAGVTVEVAIGAERAVGVPVLLEQVLVSLLLNARDALAGCEPGAPRVLRIASTAAVEGEVALVVEDTGGGIPPDILPRLFEPFATSKGPDRGRGLALAAAHGIMQAQGGRLAGTNAESGARFTLTLPRGACRPDGQAG